MTSALSDQDELERLPFFWMTQVMTRRDRRLNAALKAHNLRAPEWRALAALHARKHLPMKELADLASIDPTTLSRTIDRMQTSGWVLRITDTDDMRITRLGLTPAGEKLTARLRPIVARLNAEATDGLPQPAVDLLCWTLQGIQKNLEKGVQHDNVDVA